MQEASTKTNPPKKCLRIWGSSLYSAQVKCTKDRTQFLRASNAENACYSARKMYIHYGYVEWPLPKFFFLLSLHCACMYSRYYCSQGKVGIYHKRWGGRVVTPMSINGVGSIGGSFSVPVSVISYFNPKKMVPGIFNLVMTTCISPLFFQTHWSLIFVSMSCYYALSLRGHQKSSTEASIY